MKKALKIVAFGAAGLLILALLGLGAWLFGGPAPEDYSHLREPRIVTKPETLALKVDFSGDPETVIKEAFGSLFGVYYQLDGVPKWSRQLAPLARYEGFDELLAKVGEEKLKEVPWKGFVAIPVPATVSALPHEAESRAYPVRLEVLSYGEVAEIVHFGPYESEGPAIEKLRQHIDQAGYQIVGLHEEVYIKGPGPIPVDPEDYITIIRYRVAKSSHG